MITLIAAVARNGVIGRGGRLPWHLPADMQHFRRVTAGHTVVMGRKTWDSLPPRFRPLPGRRNIVVTRNAQWAAAGAETAQSPAAAFALADSGATVFVIGGAALYAAALPLADALVLTEIDRDVEGDTHFPPFSRGQFIEAARDTHRTPEGFDFAFVRYRRAA